MNPSTSPATRALEDSLGFRLSRLARRRRERWSRELASLSLTPPQATVLRALDESPGSGVRELARVIGSDPMRAKRCVDELETLGLVKSSQRESDRRARCLTLTERGVELTREVVERIQAHERRMQEQLGPERYEELVHTLNILEQSIGERHE